MSETWRNLPRKRVLVPGAAGGSRWQSKNLLPIEKHRRKAAAAVKNAKQQKRKRDRRRFAEQAITLFETAFAVAVLHELNAAAPIEAARPAPVAVDRET